MNKKIIIPVVLILGISLVAAISYYAMFNVSINVVQPITVEGDGNKIVPDCNAGDTCLSEEPITISNNGDNVRVVKIVDISVDDNEGVEVSYLGKIQFVNKDLNDWTTIAGETHEIEYTITGDKFVVNKIPEGYTLIYYPDMIGGFTENVAEIIPLSEGVNDIESLPIEADVGDDYCNLSETNPTNPDAIVCNGAKLWLVPTTALAGLQSGSWADASTFMFETDLITYTESTEGEITVPANSVITFYPAFTPSLYIKGIEYNFNFEIK